MLTLERARELLQCELDSAEMSGDKILVTFRHHVSGDLLPLRALLISINESGLYCVESSAPCSTGSLFSMASAYGRATTFIDRNCLVPLL